MTHPIDPQQAVAAIEKKRRQKGISINKLSLTAGIGDRYYRRLLQGNRGVSQGTIMRLRLALGRLNIGNDGHTNPESTVIYALIRTAIALICNDRGIDAEPIQKQDPNRRATASKEWADAAKVRNEAWALVNNAFGIKQSDIAKAAGVTKSAVNIALRKIEDERDNAEYDRWHDRLERDLTGGGW